MKNGLSALIDRVKGGGSILILDRGTPVARFQVAAALTAGEGEASSLAVVTLDDRLAQAAAREGLPVVDVPRS